MKPVTQAAGLSVAVCALFVCLAWPLTSFGQNGGHLPLPGGHSCSDCISQSIDLGPHTKSVTAEFFVPPDVPLDFPEVRLNYLPDGGVQGGFYVVKNDSKAGLVSVTTSWFIHVDDPNGPPAPAGQCNSSWATGRAFLAPGGKMREPLSFGLVPYKGHAVVRVTGIVIYAEFDDGSKVGPGAGTLEPRVRARRVQLLNEYRRLLGMIRAGLPDAGLEQYIQTTRGLKGLELVRAKKGWGGVAAEISKRLNLSP